MFKSILTPAVLAASLASSAYSQSVEERVWMSQGRVPYAAASEMAVGAGVASWNATGNPYAADRAAILAYRETLFVQSNWNPTFGWRQTCGVPVGGGYPGGGGGYNNTGWGVGVNAGVGGNFGGGYGGGRNYDYNNTSWGIGVNGGVGGNSGSWGGGGFNNLGWGVGVNGGVGGNSGSFRSW